MQPDAIVTIGRSLVQHGSHSDRVYLMRLAPEDCPAIISDLEALASQKGYGKIFAKIPESLTKEFLDAGYVAEAMVPGFFPALTGQGRENGFFLARYLDATRSIEPDPARVLDVLRNAKVRKLVSKPRREQQQWNVAAMTPDDAPAMAALYARVFATYPFPITDPEFIRTTMDSHVLYFALKAQGEIVALASCETEAEHNVVEMTDFATLPQMRGAGAAFHLLGHMERKMCDLGYHTAFTIARATSYGMNISFSRHGYRYAGTLTRNTQISGTLESMNVWYKPLSNTKT